MPYSRRFLREFTDDECIKICQIADARIAVGGNANGLTVDSNHAIRNARLGVAGEWAVCSWLGLSIAPVFYIHGDGMGDGGIDHFLPDGRRLHIKTTYWREGILKFPPNQTVDFDGVYVLCSRRCPKTIGAGGCCIGTEIADLCQWTDFKRGVGLQPIVRHERLHRFDELADGYL